MYLLLLNKNTFGTLNQYILNSRFGQLNKETSASMYIDLRKKRICHATRPPPVEDLRPCRLLDGSRALRGGAASIRSLVDPHEAPAPWACFVFVWGHVFLFTQPFFLNEHMRVYVFICFLIYFY